MPAQVLGERCERLGRAEPHGEGGEAAGVGGVLHLDQVLLTRQSEPVTDRGENPHPRQRAEVHGQDRTIVVRVGGVGQLDPGQSDRRGGGARGLP